MKLSDITPHSVGEIAEKRVLEQFARLRAQWSREIAWAGRVGFYLSPGYQLLACEPGEILLSERVSTTDLALTAATLCEYAQTGHGFDVENDAGAQADAANDGLLTLVLACDDPSAETTAMPDLWTREQDTNDPLAIVGRAALARIALARGDDVQRAWLAALLGVTPQRIRTLIAEGMLAAKPVERGGEERALSPITHASASQWLRARDPSRT